MGREELCIYALCRLCNRELKLDEQGIQALKQHSVKLKHVEVSKVAFLNTVRRFETSATSWSTSLLTQKKVFICWKKRQLRRQYIFFSINQQ